MDKERIFELFNEDRDSNNTTKGNIEDIYNLGMFIKIIHNHNIFHKKLEMFFQEEIEDYDVEITKSLSQSTVYNRAWFYISQINIDGDFNPESLLKFKPSQLLHTLKFSIQYFENREEYEKCSHLFKIQETLENSLDI